MTEIPLEVFLKAIRERKDYFLKSINYKKEDLREDQKQVNSEEKKKKMIQKTQKISLILRKVFIFTAIWIQMVYLQQQY